MTVQLLTIILTISGGLIGTLLSIIAYLLKGWIKDSKEWKGFVTEKVDELSNALNTVIINYNNNNANCSEKHHVIGTTLKEHTEQLNRHELEIGLLKKK